MPNFRKKPVVIEAMQLLWSNWNEMCEFADVGYLVDGRPQGCYINHDGKDVDDFPGVQGDNGRIGLRIPTLEGLMVATEGDWIIKGIQGELYPCKPDIFEQTYDEVEE